MWWVSYVLVLGGCAQIALNSLHPFRLFFGATLISIAFLYKLDEIVNKIK